MVSLSISTKRELRLSISCCRGVSVDSSLVSLVVEVSVVSLGFSAGAFSTTSSSGVSGTFSFGASGSTSFGCSVLGFGLLRASDASANCCPRSSTASIDLRILLASARNLGRARGVVVSRRASSSNALASREALALSVIFLALACPHLPVRLKTSNKVLNPPPAAPPIRYSTASRFSRSFSSSCAS